MLNERASSDKLEPYDVFCEFASSRELCATCTSPCIMQIEQAGTVVKFLAPLRKIAPDRMYRVGNDLARRLDKTSKVFQGLTGINLSRYAVVSIGRSTAETIQECPNGYLIKITQGPHQLSLDLGTSPIPYTGK